MNAISPQKHHKSKIHSGIAAATLLLILSPSQINAQTAGQIVEDNYAPPILRSSAGGVKITSEAGTDAPAGAELLYVTPSGLNVTGGFAELASETAKLEATLKNKRVSGAELFAAARALERVYADKGYILARVTLLPQTVEDGSPLNLLVTDGFIEAIEYSTFPLHVQARMEALLKGLKNQRQLTKRQLERQLLLLSDVPGLYLNSTLKAGNTLGGTILVVTGQYRPVNFNTSIDNSLSPQLSNYVANFSSDINNFFGLGEVLYFRVGTYPGRHAGIFDDMPRNRQLIMGMTLPLGDDGWWLNVEGLDSRTNPKSNQIFSIEDHYQRLSAGIGYHWLRSRDMNTSSTITFEIGDADQYLDFNGRSDWSKDKLRTIQFTQNFDAFLPWNARINASFSATAGLDMFGARQPTDILPMTRDGASPQFTKMGYTFGYFQDLPVPNAQPVKLLLASRGQTSFGAPLAASEQLGLGSMEWLSAFHSGAIQGDTSAAFRAELAYPWMFDLPKDWSSYNSQISPYIFAAAGFSKLSQATALEGSITRATSFGIGMRVGLSKPLEMRGISLSAEYARGSISNNTADNRFNLKLATAF